VTLRTDIQATSKGEYAVTSAKKDQSSRPIRLLYPTMQGRQHLPRDSWTLICAVGSSGEAAFMTGLERNSDIVYVSYICVSIFFDIVHSFAASYAPLLNVSRSILQIRRSCADGSIACC
jgi:hypothetical protein